MVACMWQDFIFSTNDTMRVKIKMKMMTGVGDLQLNMGSKQ